MVSACCSAVHGSPAAGAIAHRAGEIHVGSLAADILWEWYAYFLYFNLRMGN